MARVSTLLSERVPIPHEPEEWMRFNALPWTVLEQARRLKLDTTLDLARALPAGSSPRTGEERAVALAQRDADVLAHPSTEFDMATVLARGIHEWSYQGEVDVTDLDETTAVWAADEIIRRSRPSGADLGKGSSRSSGS